MIQIPQNLLMPLAGGLAVVAVGAGVYIGRATAHSPELPPVSQSAPAPQEEPPEPSRSAQVPAPSQPDTPSLPDAPSQAPQSPAGDVGEEGAKAAALTHAGLSESQIVNMWVQKDWDDGRLEYEVDFWQGSVEYEFEIDGATGVVLKHEREDHGSGAASGDIGEAAAKAAALEHEGLTEEQVTGLRAEKDWDDGRLEYDVKFWRGSVEYEYKIDGATGTVLKHEQEGNTGSGAASGDIGGARAKAAALAHAGLSEDQVTGIWVERDWDDGRLKYEVDFWRGAVEYEYEIDGATGTILKFERDDHAVTVAGTAAVEAAIPSAAAASYIGEEAARTAALSHAGVAADSAAYCNSWVRYGEGHHPECYQVEFLSGGCRYVYDIGLYDGAVLGHHSETYSGGHHGGAHH